MGFPFQFELGERGVEVRVGGYTVRRVRYDDIAEVRPKYSFWNEHWTNPWPWRFVTLRRRSGLLRNFVINPDDRDGFVAALERRLAERR